MGTGDIYYYDTYDKIHNTWENYRYHTPSGDYIIPSSALNNYCGFIDDGFATETIKGRKLHETYVEKLNEILYDVLLDFSGSGIKLIQSNNPYIYVGSSMNKIIEKIVIEGSDKKTSLEYDPETHEIDGFVWISLGDRDLIEITKEEADIIRRSLLVWIYENI